MKVAIIQPGYSLQFDCVDNGFQQVLSYLDTCDSSLDLIVLPEYSDVPGNVRNQAEYNHFVEKNHEILMQKVSETAVRCQALVVVNAAFESDAGYRNTTFAVDKTGKVIGRYFKAHPAPS